MYNILICDDEKDIVSALSIYLSTENYNIFTAYTGQEALDIVAKHDIHLILMDIMMPELDGFSAVKEIKKTCPDMPFIMLSALGEEYDKIHGFDLGIDDYVVKPFSTKELMMRIQAILKRTAPKVDMSDRYVIDTMVIDNSARTVTIDKERVQLSPKEYDLLLYLVKNRGIALTREQLLSNVWGYDFFGDDRTLDTHIKLLRRNLGEYARYIVTLRGVGYRFEKAD